MLTLPEIIERQAQPYIYVTYTVRMDQMQTPADQGFPQLFAHAEKHGLKPAGAPFYNYRRINMTQTLDVEAGLPLEAPGVEDGAVKAGTLPAGRFVTLDWHGHYDKLEKVTGVLIGWLRLTQQPLDSRTEGNDDYFACRLEIYESDPGEVQNPDEWLTTLAFKLKD